MVSIYLEELTTNKTGIFNRDQFKKEMSNEAT